MKKLAFVLTAILASANLLAEETKTVAQANPDMELLIYSGIAGAVITIFGLVILKLKGRDTLIRLITRAEILFDYGKNSEKLEYVLSNARMVIPAPFKWFVTKESVGKLVAFLREDLGIIQASKNSENR